MNRMISFILLLPVWLSSVQASVFASSNAVVHAVLFFSPNCGHCHLVITETFPPLFDKYGDRLYIVGIDVNQPDGNALFLATMRYFNIQNAGVPLLVVGDNYLIGSMDIPEQFPGMIEYYLAQGGVDWPPVPELKEALSTTEPTEASVTQTSQPTAVLTAPASRPTKITNSPTTLSTEPPVTVSMQIETTPVVMPSPTELPPASNSQASPTQGTALLLSNPGVVEPGSHSGNLKEKFLRDPQGNTLAVIVLVLMVLSIFGGIMFLVQPASFEAIGKTLLRFKDWLIPILCLLGLVVAGYLAYVETAQVEAVCGPVGDCNTVQHSTYAKLFGVMPIGIMGIVGYVMILLAWVLAGTSNRRLAAFSWLALFGMTTFGVLFSIYLTFLEPFVIGATCAWCLTSAIIMTVLFWLSVAQGRKAWDFLHNKESEILFPIG